MSPDKERTIGTMQHVYGGPTSQPLAQLEEEDSSEEKKGKHQLKDEKSRRLFDHLANHLS